MSLIELTLMSTKPAARPIWRTPVSVRSVATPDAFLGHAIHRQPLGTSFFAKAVKWEASTFSESAKKTIKSIAWAEGCTRTAVPGSSTSCAMDLSCGFKGRIRVFSLILTLERRQVGGDTALS